VLLPGIELACARVCLNFTTASCLPLEAGSFPALKLLWAERSLVDEHDLDFSCTGHGVAFV
jgi:hypothetical protein